MLKKSILTIALLVAVTCAQIAPSPASRAGRILIVSPNLPPRYARWIASHECPKCDSSFSILLTSCNRAAAKNSCRLVSSIGDRPAANMEPDKKSRRCQVDTTTAAFGAPARRLRATNRRCVARSINSGLVAYACSSRASSLASPLLLGRNTGFHRGSGMNRL
jgi:hypothetical protein